MGFPPLLLCVREYRVHGQEEASLMQQVRP